MFATDVLTISQGLLLLPFPEPDRVVVFNNHVYLLDYKTGEKNQKHQNQINEYAFVLHEMNYTIAKKALVYIGEKIEVVLL